MNCKKCNTETDGDILCNNCSDEILKLHIIDKIPADVIENRFNLLPNTVAYWCNYCKEKYGDNHQYLSYECDVNSMSKTKNLGRFYLDLYLLTIILLIISSLFNYPQSTVSLIYFLIHFKYVTNFKKFKKQPFFMVSWILLIHPFGYYLIFIVPISFCLQFITDIFKI